jgi:hypothetical protein
MMSRFVTRYLAFAGLLANLLPLVLLLFWAWGKAMSTDEFRGFVRSWVGPLDGIEVVPIIPVPPGRVNPALQALPVNTWYKIHEQAIDADAAFSLQAHGGAAFDPVRGRIMLFGSDTHRQNWDNTVRFFDVGSLAWSMAYPPDLPETYRVNSKGIPVAGEGVERPWAMHVFDALEFDPISDLLIVASYPGHLNPKHRWGVSASLWQGIRSHPTWGYRVADGRWEVLAEKGQSFFPYAATFDPIRRELIGVRPQGYWSFDVDRRKWQKIGQGAPSVWHNTAAFDAARRVVVSFGSQKRHDDVWQLRVDEGEGVAMPTVGQRPPGGSSVPLVYHPGIDRVVAMIEALDPRGRKITQTWLYSTANDTWQPLAASLPFGIGMNYRLTYDPNHDLLLLVARMPREPVAVWALRLDQNVIDSNAG